MKQKKQWNNTRRIVIILLDVLVFQFSIYLSFLIKFSGDIPERNFYTFEQSSIYISIAFVLLNFLLGSYVFYNRLKGDILFNTVISQILISLAIMIITFFGRWFAFPRSVLALSFLISVVFLSLFRIIVYQLYLKFSATKKVAVVGGEEKVASAIRNFDSDKNNRHKVVCGIVGDFTRNVSKIVDDVDIVYLADELPENEKIAIYELVTRKEKKLFLPTTFENLVMIRPNMMNFEDESIIEASEFRINEEEDFLKRIFDIVISLILLIIASPFMLVTAALIKVTSPGPIIYKQTRITLNQREFSILKFRSMSATAEAKSGPVLASSNDARVTTVGKYIRALRIDELPQLINVLRGDMSIVGPRPERPFFVDQFKAENAHYYLRHNVRAGITGYAQVYGKYASDYNSKLNFDLLYIKNYSLLLDMKILLQTIKILFDKVSSKGVDESELSVMLDLSRLKEIKILK